MSEISEFNLEPLEKVELDSLVHDNTQARAQATFMHLHGHNRERIETIHIITKPKSGLEVDPQKVIDALKSAWDGSDEKSVTEGAEKRAYWQSWEPGSFMNWTTVINYKLMGKGRKQHEVFDGAVITANQPSEYQALLARSETPEIIRKAQDKKNSSVGRYAAKAALLNLRHLR